MRQHVIMAGGVSAIGAVVVRSGSWQRGLAVSVADLPVDRGNGIRPRPCVGLRGPGVKTRARACAGQGLSFLT